MVSTKICEKVGICAVKYVQPGLLHSPTMNIAYFHELNMVQTS